jgi:hypothetical protein
MRTVTCSSALENRFRLCRLKSDGRLIAADRPAAAAARHRHDWVIWAPSVAFIPTGRCRFPFST